MTPTPAVPSPYRTPVVSLRRRFTASAVVAALLCCAAARGEAPQEQPAPPDAGLIGAGGTLWAYEFRHDSDARGGMRFVFRGSHTPGGTLFVPLPLGALKEAPAATAARGDYLHLFLPSAGHQRLAARRALPVEPVPAVRFVEIDLPNRAVPPVAAGDTPGDAVFALVSPGQAVEIVDDARRRHEQQQRRRDRGSRASADTTGPSAGAAVDDPDAPGEPPAAPPPFDAEDDFDAAIVARGGAWFVARYASAAWSLDRVGPPDLGPESRLVALAARDGALHLLTQSDGGGLRHHVSPSSAEAWREPIAVPVDGSAVVLATGWVKDALVLAVRRDGSAAPRLLRFDGQTWAEGAPLIDGPTPAQAVGTPEAVGLFDEGVALARREDRGLLQVGVWSIETGGQTEPYQTIYALTPPAAPLLPVWGMELIQIIVFLVIFGLMIAWRREAVATSAVLPPGRILCPPMLRMFAFLLDSLIIAPIWALTYYAILVGDGTGLTFGERLQLGVGLTTSMGALLPALFGLIFAVYATASELWMCATLGKRIVGAQVASVDGRPCVRWRIVVRNLVRVIEFALPGVLLLVVLTRNRQRFGDLAAGTIVIARLMPSDDAPGLDEDEPPQR